MEDKTANSREHENRTGAAPAKGPKRANRRKTARLQAVSRCEATVFRGKGGAAEPLSAVFLQKNQREPREARADVELVMGLEPATCSLRMSCSTN